MKIETKFVLNNMQKNIKRTIFTTISIILCTVLIFTAILLISTIRIGIDENIEKYYADYHFIIKDLDIDEFNKIKDKEYIQKIYIQEGDNNPIEEMEKSYTSLSTYNSINVYIKYKNIKNVCKYSNEIIRVLNVGDSAISKCYFNKKLLTMYGLIDAEIVLGINSVVCMVRLNYLYIMDMIVIITLLTCSILFIVVLYNAFIITISERKREYAILNSIGGTEGQILKMIFLECIIMGVVSIIIGGLISIIATSVVIKRLNNILVNTGFNFRLIFDNKYILLAIFIIIINIFLSSIIPSIKASTTSVIQGIRNNKQIKYKRRNTILEKILPIEGKIAIKNIKRNINKYRVITTLLIVCITAYITVSTYINYEKETSELMIEYDVDAILSYDSKYNMDYESMLNDYDVNYDDKIRYTENNIMGLYALIEPEEVLITDSDQDIHKYKDNKTHLQIEVIGLDDKIYNNYIDKLNANYGDFIIYNNVTQIKSGGEKFVYTFNKVFKTGDSLSLSIIGMNYNDEKKEYEIIDNENLQGKYILTDELIEWYKEIKTDLRYGSPAVFVNMDVYNKIKEKVNNYGNSTITKTWLFDEMETIKIKCNNIIEFSNYIEDVSRKQNIEIYPKYYGLENHQKIIYINIVELILNVIIVAIMSIGIISTSNIINASLCEREQDFKILYRLGATKRNINKILIYELFYMFIKAIIISIVLSVPILYVIIKKMKNIIILNKLLIPYGNISTFFMIILIIYFIIELCSTRVIKE